MSTTRLRFAVVAVLVVLASLAVAACGSDSKDSGSSGDATTKSVPTGQKGGTVTALSAGDVDYMDPGQMYYTFGYQVGYSVNRALYYFSPEDSSKQIPDIADGEPTIAEDGKSMTIKLKEGVKFSPPVSRAVKCDDIKYAFERAFSENVPNAYATQYFGDIVGAPSKPTKGIKDISGITCPDDQTIAFALKTPTAGAVYAALVMPITMPVPREYASKFDESNPSTYDKNVVFTGPYQVKNKQRGQAHRLGAGQADQRDPQPELGCEDRLPPGLPGHLEDRRGQHRRGDREQAASCRVTAWSRATAPRRPRCSSRPRRGTRAS